MTVTPEQIMAYVDGELDPAEHDRVADAALADRALAERIAAERALRATLGAHFAPVAEAAVPAAWVEQIRGATGPLSPPVPVSVSADVIDFAGARARKAAAGGAAKARWWSNPWAGAAIAASLVIGVLAGSQWRGAGHGQPITASDGALVASGDLAVALDSQLASAQAGAPIRILGTFHRGGGDICRAFSGPQAAGIACRAGEGWQLQHVLPGAAASATDYRQAGSDDAELMALAQDMAAGAPLDAGQERQARARGWR